jgi:hypothetical protein
MTLADAQKAVGALYRMRGRASASPSTTGATPVQGYWLLSGRTDLHNSFCWLGLARRCGCQSFVEAAW